MLTIHMTPDNKIALLKAAQIARIKLSSQEENKLVSEIDEILKVFSKIDQFKETVEKEKPAIERHMREDKAKKSGINPFSNSKLVKNKKFLGPRLVD